MLEPTFTLSAPAGEPTFGNLGEPGTPAITTGPLPGSTKIYVEGSRRDLRVPMREIHVSPTHTSAGLTVQNPPVTIYDPSGPYTDPEAALDVPPVLPPPRRPLLLSPA